MVLINNIEDYKAVEHIGLQPDDRLPNDYLRMVARIFAAYRESPLTSAVVAYLDGFQISAFDNISEDTYDFTISAGSAFIDDQFIGFKDSIQIKEPRSHFVADQDYSIVLHYEWINITPPTIPTIKFLTYLGPESIDSESMLELGRFTITPTRDFIMHPQDLNGMYLKNFVKLFSSVETTIIENIDAFKFNHIVIPDSSLAPEVVSGDFVYFDWVEALYKKARACTKKFDKAVGLYLKNKSSGTNMLIFNGIIQIDATKYLIDDSHLHLTNLEAGATYYLEDGCTETSDILDFESYAFLSDFPAIGRDGVYFRDLSTDIIYEWDGAAYVVSNPQPNLTQTRGKITTRFFPSTVRVGFAIDHRTLNINMDYSSELNIMNILELVGNSELFAQHYDSFKNYFKVLEDITNYNLTSLNYDNRVLSLNTSINEVGGLQDQIDAKNTSIGSLQVSYDNAVAGESYAIVDADNQNVIGGSINDYSKTQSDILIWSNLEELVNTYSESAAESLKAAEASIRQFNTLIGTLDTGNPAYASLLVYANTLNNNINGTIVNSFGGNVTDALGNYILANTFVSTMHTELLDRSSINRAMFEYDAVTLGTILNRIKIDWLPDFEAYLDWNKMIPGSATLVRDLGIIKEELEYLNAPRTHFLADTTFDSIMAEVSTIEEMYYKGYKWTLLTKDILENIIYPFALRAVLNNNVSSDADIQRAQSDTNQLTVKNYIDERVSFQNSTYDKYYLIKEAEAELAYIQETMNRTLREVLFFDGINDAIKLTTLPGLAIDQAQLEQAPDGIIAKIEYERPIQSIFYLSNFERIQYNYTYLTIRIRSKYSVLDGVQANIDLITAKLNELSALPLVDQSQVAKLAKLKTSYEVVRAQILAELDSMIAEYNKIRSDSYGLPPIAPGDRDFADGIIDTNGDGIPDITSGFSYANPDLACMAISE